MSRERLGPIAAAASALVVALALAACGGEGDSAAAGGTQMGPVKVVGGGSAAYRVPAGRAYVAEWGKEASEEELEAAAEAEHGYLVAVVEKDWIKACSLISETLMQRLASHAKVAGEGCAAQIATRAKPPLPNSDHDSTEVEAESLRSDGAWAFLLYRAANARYYMPVVKELGRWKVNIVAPIAFDG